MNKILFLLVLLSGACSREFVSDDTTHYEWVEVQVMLQTEDQQIPGGVAADKEDRSRAAAQDAPADQGPVSICFGTGCWDAPGQTDPASADSRAVRAVDPSTVDVTTIQDVWAMQYDPSGNLVGRPVYRSGLTAGASIKLMLVKSGTAVHTLYLVANTGDSSAFTVDNIPTLSHLQALTHAYTDETSVIDGGVLMSGSWQGVISDGATLPTVKMTRAVAKLTFTYSTDRFRDGVLQVLNVQLKNVPLCASYLPQADASVTAYPAGAPGSHSDYAVDLAPGESSGSYTWIVPENVRGANPSILGETEKTGANAPAGQAAYATFIEVHGKVTWAGGTVQNVLYTLFAGADPTDYSLRRNGAYTMEVAFVGASDDDGRVQKDDASPFLSTQVAFAEITGAHSIATGVVTSDGGSPLTEVGFYLSPTAGFDPAGADVTKFVGTLDAAATTGTGTHAVTDALPDFAASYSAAPARTGTGAVTNALTGLGATPYAAVVGTAFTAQLSGLDALTTYYVRPYAANAYGTTVGVESSFTTNGLPTIVTGEATGVTNRDAFCAYDLIDGGASPVSEKGLLFSTTRDFDPLAADVKKSTEESPVNMARASGNYLLDWDVTYYYRAFAKNRAGTVYGEQKSFKTLDWPTITRTQLYWIKGVSVGAVFDIYYRRGEPRVKPAEYGFEIGPIGFTPGTGIEVQGTITYPNAANADNYKASTPYTGDEWEVRFYAKHTEGVTRHYTGVIDSYLYKSTMCPLSYPQTTVTFLKNIDAPYGPEYSHVYLGYLGAYTPPSDMGDIKKIKTGYYYSNSADDDPVSEVIIEPSQRKHWAGIFFNTYDWGDLNRGDDNYTTIKEEDQLHNFRVVVEKRMYSIDAHGTFDFYGSFTSYSPEVSMDMVPTASVPTVSAITATSAMISVANTSAGSAPGSTIVDRGITLDTEKYKHGTGNTIIDGSSMKNTDWLRRPMPRYRPAVTTGTDAYMLTLTGLTTKTTYYVRSYAKNSEDNRYVSSWASFTTL